MFLKPSRFVQMLVLSCCFVVSAAAAASAAPGDLDRSFGQAGVSEIQSESGAYVVPEDMAMGPNGEIYVLRSTFRCSVSPCTSEHMVSRLSSAGIIDRSFGIAGTGHVFSSPGQAHINGDGLAVAPGGQIVVGSTEGGKLVLARLGADGRLDGTFAGEGVVKADLGSPVDRARVAVQADGRIVVAAEPKLGYGGNAVIVTRYTSGGAPDQSFHGGVPVVTSLGSGVGDFALVGSGAVFAGPRCCGFPGRAVHLARFDQAGALDSGFGREGQSFVDDVTDTPGVGAVVALPDGRIYVVGSGRGGSHDAFALRMLPNGTLDPRFGNRGITYMKRSRLEVSGAEVDRAGRLLIAGIAPTETRRGRLNGPRRLTVLRRLSDGRRDRTFAGGSLMHLDGPIASQATAVGLQDGSKLVVLASTVECFRICSSPNSFLVRFIGGTSASRCQGRRATIVGTRQGEKLTGTPRRDVISALAGNDVVRGFGGNDLICGGRGDDSLRGGKGLDKLRGGPGRNRLRP
jgi:uncharacterized delta-60 repeat protein